MLDAASMLSQAPVSAATTVANALTPKTHTHAHGARTLTADASSSTSTSSTASTASDGTTITSNDFLTLLVSELKNQDPTQPTDPNAYIQQLVGVNSLQQLISINKGITSISTEPTTATTAV